MDRININTGAPWEDLIGYSRAVKIGSVLEISGTTAVQGEKIQGLGDPYEQTFFILSKIKKVIEDSGGRLEDVIRTRIFVTNIENWEQIGRAHGAFFKHIKPAATMVEVSRLIHPDLLVEIEATAILSINDQ